MSADPKLPAEDAPETYTPKIDRRTAIAWVIAGGGAVALAGAGLFAIQNPHGLHPANAKGYGTDPKLNPPLKAPWPRILTTAQLQTAAILADHILPASGTAPSASAVGVPDFIDEWVSAPYPDQVKDRPLVLKGLDDLGDLTKGNAAERAAKFAALPGTPFFKKFRRLTIGAYYTTPAGFKDIGYIGNVARAVDPGPSEAVKAHLERQFAKLGL